MSAAKLERTKPPTTVAELVAYERAQRKGPAPDGNILEAATLAENLTAVLAEHVERLSERWPKQPTRWNGNNGRFEPDGPPPEPFDPSSDSTARSLATLIGYLEDLATR